MTNLTNEKEGITVIGLNRPNAKNAFSFSLTSGLFKTVENLAYDNSVRAVVLRSLVPDVFCAGYLYFLIFIHI